MHTKPNNTQKQDCF